MMHDDEQICRDVVYRFCVSHNEWEELFYSLNRYEERLREGKFIADRLKKKVEGTTIEEQRKRHAEIFEEFVVSRKRVYGNSPGEPNSWCDKGTYQDVSIDTIVSVNFPRKSRCEVVTKWGHHFSGIDTMFVLLKKNNEWKIDGIKTYSENMGQWDVPYL